MTVKVTVDKLASIVASISKLATKDVLVGIPDSKTDRTGEGEQPTNATLGYIHEYGSDAQGIPPRPFLNTGVEKSLPDVMPILRKAALASLDGSDSGVERQLNNAGLKAQNHVRNEIATADYAPLKPSTIANRWRNRQTKTLRESEKNYLDLVKTMGMYPEDAQALTGIRPLDDTGQLRRSISYVIRKK